MVFVQMVAFGEKSYKSIQIFQIYPNLLCCTDENGLQAVFAPKSIPTAQNFHSYSTKNSLILKFVIEKNNILDTPVSHTKKAPRAMSSGAG